MNAAALIAVLALLSPLGLHAGEPGADGAALATVAGRPMLLYVARRGWHIDVGFAAADLAPPLDAVARRFAGARYVFFGFGDRHYLLAKNSHLPALLGAIWPGAGLVLVTALDNTPTDAFGATAVAALRLPARQALAAQSFIANSLAGANPYGPGPYADSLYYEARPRYSGWHTCNTWVAETLRSADLPVRTTGVVFAGQLWPEVQRLAHRASLPQSRASLPQ